MLREIFKETELYNDITNDEHKKSQGQFFTSMRTVEFMGDFCTPRSRSVSILDPGAGNGSLTAAAVKHLVDNLLCDEIRITLVENDESIIPLLKKSISLIQDYCEDNNVKCSANLVISNFILATFDSKYDLIICNPPYKKVRKTSVEAIKMQEYVYGQPNLYALFMAKSLSLMNDGGEFVFITPRSWTSGSYFTRVRRAVQNELSINKIHVFNSRKKTFTEENVLQETMILFARKTKQSNSIKISISEDDSYKGILTFDIDADIIKNVGTEDYLLIPGSLEESKLISDMKAMPETFESLGYVFRTGPVVEFRNKELISEQATDIFNVPMFRSLNIKNDTLVFPVSSGKAQYVSSNAHHLLVRNEDTVLVKRLSAKEENRRIQSCVYYRQGAAPYMSVENHVNYVARKDGKALTKEEAEWIHSVLSSEKYDVFFRIINGSTQVNAAELNILPVRRVAL